MVSLRKARLLVGFLLLFNFKFLSAKTYLKEKCTALISTTFCTRYYKNSCLTVSTQTGNTFEQAKTSCKHFSHGHLLIPTNRELVDILKGMLIQIRGSPNWCWIGLHQSTTGSEPSGGWYWQTKDVEILANPTTLTWDPPEPNDAGQGGTDEDCAVAHHTLDLLDYNCDRTDTRTACQYRDHQVNFERLYQNKKLTNDLSVGQQTLKYIGHCGNACHDSPFCTAFSYNAGTKDCLLFHHADTTVAAADYDLYRIK